MAQQRAEQLLSAQVDFVIAELSGDRFARNVSVDTSAVLEALASVRVSEVMCPDEVKDTVRMVFTDLVGSDFADQMVLAVSDAGYDASANEDFRLGDVVPRHSVDALLTKILSLETAHDRLLDRLSESPLLAVVASRFVTQLVSDFFAQSREKAERIPGMAPVLRFSTNAGAKLRGDRRLDERIGDAAAKGAAVALRRTTTAIRHVLRDPSFGGALMQVWDAHADEPVGDLRLYLTQLDLRELVEIGFSLLLEVRSTPYFEIMLDECVDVLYDNYGDHSVRDLLTAMGLSGAHIESEIVKYAPGVIEATKATGALAKLVRGHLEPFFLNPATLAILGDNPLDNK